MNQNEDQIHNENNEETVSLAPSEKQLSGENLGLSLGQVAERPGIPYHGMPILQGQTETQNHKKSTPAETRARDHWLHVRLSDQDVKALTTLQERLGESNRSDLVRKMLGEAAGQGHVPLKEDLTVFREAVEQLAAVGRNLNQMTHAFHIGQAGALKGYFDLHKALSHQVAALQTEFRAIMQRSRNRW